MYIHTYIVLKYPQHSCLSICAQAGRQSENKFQLVLKSNNVANFQNTHTPTGLFTISTSPISFISKTSTFVCLSVVCAKRLILHFYLQLEIFILQKTWIECESGSRFGISMQICVTEQNIHTYIFEQVILLTHVHKSHKWICACVCAILCLP